MKKFLVFAMLIVGTMAFAMCNQSDNAPTERLFISALWQEDKVENLTEVLKFRNQTKEGIETLLQKHGLKKETRLNNSLQLYRQDAKTEGSEEVSQSLSMHFSIEIVYPKEAISQVEEFIVSLDTLEPSTIHLDFYEPR